MINRRCFKFVFQHKNPIFGITQQMKQKLLKYAPELETGASRPTNVLLGALHLGPPTSRIGHFPRASPPSKREREVDSGLQKCEILRHT